MHVVIVEVPQLGNRCHLVHDGSTALVVDPPRDLAAVERVAEEAGVDIAAVADTHVHNDYVSGALALSRRHGADYLLAAGEAVAFERVGVSDGDLLAIGNLQLRVIATPGHTRHHQSFLVRGQAGPAALFSGGSLLHGTVGRTDLVDDLLTRDLARAQWASAHTLGCLDPDTHLHPTHGFGSFCAATTASESGREVTIGDQFAQNAALRLDRDRFVEHLVAGFGPTPTHYDHMAPLNRAGAGRRSPRPARPLNAEQLAEALAAGARVVDLRPRADYAEQHVPGTVSVEYADQFATYVGWVTPWGSELVLLTDRLPDLAPALRDLAGIGIEGVGTHVTTDTGAADPTYRRTDWRGYQRTDSPQVVVDVRQRDEFAAGHLAGAFHVPVQEVEAQMHELPEGTLWVHCKSGYRAAIAASLLHRSGRSVVHVDDDWERVAELAIPTTAGLAA